MKNSFKFKFLIFFLLFKINSSKAQITLDTIIHTPSLVYFFNTVQISDTETKYYIADTINNTFTLYNMDFTPFISNVSVPEPFINNTLPAIFRAIYITRTLFDCDSLNVEYAYEAATNNYCSFYIMRTDGTQLFKLDSANGPFCFGDCLGGADWIKPIVNTSSGSKLFLQRPNVIEDGSLHIYSLCGTLPKIFNFINDNIIESYLTIFPNPTSKKINFKINLPNNNDSNEYELILFNENGIVLNRIKVDLFNRNYSIDISNYKNGTYIYSLCTKDKSYQNGKFIVQN